MIKIIIIGVIGFLSIVFYIVSVEKVDFIRIIGGLVFFVYAILWAIKNEIEKDSDGELNEIDENIENDEPSLSEDRLVVLNLLRLKKILRMTMVYLIKMKKFSNLLMMYLILLIKFLKIQRHLVFS